MRQQSEPTVPDASPASGPAARWLAAAWQPPLRWALLLTVLLALGQALPAVRFFATGAHYLALHSLLEMVSIAVSAMVFALAWNLRRQDGSQQQRLVLGVAFLAVCLIDTAHLLSYAGMPDLVTPSSPEKAINFWLAGRIVAVAALLLVALAPALRVPAPVWLGCGLGLSAAVWWVGLQHADLVPRTFVAGSGLTPFKVGIEYLLAAAYALAALLLARQGRAQGKVELQWLAAAAWVQALAEMFFTLYADVTDIFNLLGHVYKALSYLMVYRALFVSGVQQPYRELADERSRLRALVAAIPDPVWLKDSGGVYLSCNAAFQALRGVGEAAIVGRTDDHLLPPSVAEAFRRSDRVVMNERRPLHFEDRLPVGAAAGVDHRLYEVIKTPLCAADGSLIGVLGLAHDITPLRSLQHDLQERIKERDCLHDVFRLTEDLQAPLAGQLQAVADRLPAGWQQPQRAMARVQLDGVNYDSPGFVVTAGGQQASIPSASDDRACVSVHYRSGTDAAPGFLAEEQKLLDAVAARLGSVIAQRAVARSLRDREAVFSAIAAQAEDSIALIDRAGGRFVEFNDAAAHNLGYSREEFARLTVHDVEVDRTRQDIDHISDQVWTQGNLVLESRNRCKDGSVRDVLVRLRKLDIGGHAYFAATCTDITERKRAELVMRESEQHFRTLANGGSALIWTSGLDQGCTYFNDPWLRFTGRRLEQELGTGWCDGVHSDDLAHCMDTYSRAFERREPFSMEYRLRRFDGEHRWLRDDGNPRYDTQGRFLGYIGFCVDVTEQKRAAAELERYRQGLEALVDERTRELARAKEVAEAAAVAKSTFLANMSHEIRTPLNAIMGMAHLVRRSGVSPQQGERLAKIDAAGEHLLSVLNAVLDLSKIDAGKFPLERVTIDVERVVANVAAMLSDKAQARQLKLVLQTDAVPRQLVGDATRLQQALLNYVANAVKFAEAGQVIVRARVVDESADSVQLRFEVQDSGPGIDAATLARLFSAFEQADSSTTRRFGGTGLGLALTRRLAEMMGGQAGASSQPGQGSLFWFSARLGKVSASPRPLPTAVPGQAEPGSVEALLKARHAGRRVLVAEDDAVNRELVQFLLQDAGLHCELVEDGARAVECARTQAWDLILMDMQMPRLDGLQAARLIRQQPGLDSLPIVAMTANAFADDKARCRDAGMVDFVAKPIVPEQLFRALLKWLDAAAQRAPTALDPTGTNACPTS